MSLKPGAHIHFMGICGTAMASLAGILRERGFKITGSDTQAYPPMSIQLEKLGIPIKLGYKREHLNPRPDFVIVGNVIMKKYEEAQALLESDIPYTSLPKAMAEFVIENRESIVIAGTHGKTTTTSLMAWIAECCQVGAGYLVGGIPQNFGQSFKNPTGNYFVIEGDEYDTAFFDKVPKFIHYKPKHVILTSVEFDHADIYADLAAVKKAFVMLMQLIPTDGTLLAYAECDNVLEVITQTKCKKVYTYGITKGDYQARNIKTGEQGTEFSVYFQNQSVGEVQMTMFGDHNVKNALAAFAMSREQGWDLNLSQRGIKTFTGVKRRQEIIGEPRGITVIEDFAHHPTAVKETISSIKKRYPGRRVFAVFEPRSATSRRRIFQKDYVDAFIDANEVILSIPYDQSTIADTDRFSSEELCSDIIKQGIGSFAYKGNEEIIQRLQQQTHRGDIILVMSNGGFGGIYKDLLKALEKGG